MFYDYTDTDGGPSREASVPAGFWHIPTPKTARRIKSPAIRNIITSMKSQGCKLEVIIIKRRANEAVKD